ncbi:POK8 protein, partial [Uria aalge]|nr:POK8 protein [Uria aalge]
DLVILDLKDCFFTIPLHPEDTDKFAFTVPTKNREAPSARYKWVVLPQGMKNLPTICQWYVDLALKNFRKRHDDILLYHYMDDLLLARPGTVPEELVEKLT